MSRAMSWLVCIVFTLAPGLGAAASTQTRSVTSPRPIAAALRLLETESGRPITYEDSRYLHPSEIEDVTERVSKRRGKSGAPVLGPKSSAIEFSYRVDERSRPLDLREAIRSVLELDAARGARFIAWSDEDEAVFHVAATAVLGPAGTIDALAPALDQVIHVPPKPRSGLEFLEAICKAVSATGRYPLILGVVPTNALQQHRMSGGIIGAKARPALSALLARLNRRLSWSVLHDVTRGADVLNIHMVRPIQ